MKKRDIGQELLESIRSIKAGKGKRLPRLRTVDVGAVRQKLGYSQTEFAAYMGVNIRTLQEWEQGRRNPSGAARTLLLVADKHPEAIRDSLSAE